MKAAAPGGDFREKRFLVMPLMTQGASGNCGVFPKRWEPLVSKMLAMVVTGSATDEGMVPIPVNSVVVSSFSSGISYSHAFVTGAGLGSKLKGIIDFDGSFSSFRAQSATISAGFNPVVRMQQMAGVTEPQIPIMAAQNLFPLPPTRFNKLLTVPAADDLSSMMMIHGLIPQVTMFQASRRVG